jgi:TMEM175 potassium channel family protein
VTSWLSRYRPRGIVQSRGEGDLEFARVVAFSDGVMAIAITLLVLTLDVPNVPDGDLAEALGDQWRQYLAFALSFALIGRFWIVHHRAFRLLERFDGTLMVLNLVFLALIVVMPFATNLVAQYENDPVCIVVYASVVGLASLMTWVMIRYSLRSGHVRAEMRPLAAGGSSWIGLGPPLTFLASAPVALLSSGAAFALWLVAVGLSVLSAAITSPEPE